MLATEAIKKYKEAFKNRPFERVIEAPGYFLFIPKKKGTAILDIVAMDKINGKIEAYSPLNPKMKISYPTKKIDNKPELE